MDAGHFSVWTGRVGLACPAILWLGAGPPGSRAPKLLSFLKERIRDHKQNSERQQLF